MPHRTTISVSDEHLSLVMARQHELPGSKLRIDATADGLDIVANREGWLTLAKWCMVMAHPELDDTDPPHHLDWDVMHEAGERGDLTLGFWGLPRPAKEFQDVNFWRRSEPSAPLEPGDRPGDNSPYTHTAADRVLADLRHLDHASRARVITTLGRPLSQHVEGDGMCLEFVREPHLIEVFIGPDDNVSGMSIRLLPPNKER
ncbi:MAG: hypothetical protein HY876_06130 [Coriobacteriales bacterium]|nr:hypothetical protein [Coriobacteriales bacterium]